MKVVSQNSTLTDLGKMTNILAMSMFGHRRGTGSVQMGELWSCILGMLMLAVLKSFSQGLCSIEICAYCWLAMDLLSATWT